MVDLREVEDAVLARYMGKREAPRFGRTTRWSRTRVGGGRSAAAGAALIGRAFAEQAMVEILLAAPGHAPPTRGPEAIPMKPSALIRT